MVPTEVRWHHLAWKERQIDLLFTTFDPSQIKRKLMVYVFFFFIHIQNAMFCNKTGPCILLHCKKLAYNKISNQLFRNVA